MKGHVQIELIDQDGNRQKIEGDNIVTNLMSKAHEHYYRTVRSPMAPFAFTTGNLSKAALNFSDGLILFGEEILDGADDLFVDKDVVAYAGDSSGNGADPLWGNYNDTESGPITNGYRHVWDFATDKANVTIAALALVQRAMIPYVGNPGGSNAQITYDYSSEFKGDKFYSTCTGLEYNLDYLCYSDGYGTLFQSVGSTINKRTMQTALAYESGFGWDTESFDFSVTYSSIKGLIYKDFFLWTCGYHIVDAKWYLLKINPTTMIVDTSYDLSEQMITIDGLGLINGYAVIVDYASGNMNCHMYNIATQSFGSPLTIDGTFSGHYFPAVSCTTCGNTMLIASCGLTSDGYANARINNEVILAFHDGVPSLRKGFGLWYYAEKSINGADPHKQTLCVAIDGSPLVHYNTRSYTSNEYGMRLGHISPSALQTRKNLDTPFTKLDTQTMKITYELTW